jgi:hypothetical protein
MGCSTDRPPRGPGQRRYRVGGRNAVAGSGVSVTDAKLILILSVRCQRRCRNPLQGMPRRRVSPSTRTLPLPLVLRRADVVLGGPCACA